MQKKESKTNWHFYISLVKSGIRFGAGGVLFMGQLEAVGVLIILGEILRIVEEL